MVTNRVLYEAFQALAELGAIRLPALLAWKLAVNRNALRDSWNALEDAKRQMLGALANIAPPWSREETAQLNVLEQEWVALLARGAAQEWTPTVTIAVSAFAKIEVPGNALAALQAAGILIED